MAIEEKKPEILVHPLIFEKIEDSCDLIDIQRNMNEFPLFNWKLFYPIKHLPIYQLNYCDNYPEQSKNNKSYHAMGMDNFRNKNSYDFHNLALEAMKSLQKTNQNIESSVQTIRRLEMFKDYINYFIGDKRNEFLDEDKVIVIGHSILFKHLTSKYLSDENFEPSRNEFVLNNCEAVGLSFI